MKKENTIEEKQNVVVFVYRKKVFFFLNISTTKTTYIQIDIEKHTHTHTMEKIYNRLMRKKATLS